MRSPCRNFLYIASVKSCISFVQLLKSREGGGVCEMDKQKSRSILFKKILGVITAYFAPNNIEYPVKNDA